MALCRGEVAVTWKRLRPSMGKAVLWARTGDETKHRTLADLGSRSDPTAVWMSDVDHNSNL